MIRKQAALLVGLLLAGTLASSVSQAVPPPPAEVPEGLPRGGFGVPVPRPSVPLPRDPMPIEPPPTDLLEDGLEAVPDEPRAGFGVPLPRPGGIPDARGVLDAPLDLVGDALGEVPAPDAEKLLGEAGLTDDEATNACTSPPREVHGLGLACAIAGGWRVFLADHHLDTHGLDPQPEEAPQPAASSQGWYPGCTEDPSSLHVELIFAYPKFRRDPEGPGRVRQAFLGANQWFADAAAKQGEYMNVRALCDDSGQPVVHEVESDSWDLGAVIMSARASGHTRKMAKYWMVYHDPAQPRGGGVAEIHADSRPGPENWHNQGASGSMYGLTYGYSSFVMAHEGAHTMGAVQNDAPHSTGGYHCTDGLDLMCYADDGPLGSQYRDHHCRPMVVDCNGDDYFNVHPIAWEYTGTHWNLASRANLIMDRCGDDGSAQVDVALCTVEFPTWAKPGDVVRVKGTLRNSGGSALPSPSATLEVEGEASRTIVLEPLAAHETRSIEVELELPSGDATVRSRNITLTLHAEGDERPENNARVGDIVLALPRAEYAVALRGGPVGHNPYDEPWSHLENHWWEYGDHAPTFLKNQWYTKPDILLVSLPPGTPASLDARFLLEDLREGVGLLWSGRATEAYAPFLGLGTPENDENTGESVPVRPRVDLAVQLRGGFVDPGLYDEPRRSPEARLQAHGGPAPRFLEEPRSATPASPPDSLTPGTPGAPGARSWLGDLRQGTGLSAPDATADANAPPLGPEAPGDEACRSVSSHIVVFEDPEFSRNVSIPHVPGNLCGSTYPEPAQARTVATSPPDGVFQIRTFAPENDLIGAGTTVHASWDLASAHLQANPGDVQIIYNALGWLHDHRRKFDVDLSVTGLTGFGIAGSTTLGMACAGYPFKISGYISNHGTREASYATVTAWNWIGAPTTVELGSIPPGGKVPFEAMVQMKTPPNQSTTITVDVDSPDDNVTADDVEIMSVWVYACTPPGAATDVRALPGPGSTEATIHFTAGTTGGSPFVRWRIERQSAERVVVRDVFPRCIPTYTSDPWPCSIVESGLDPETPYTFAVIPYNGAGEGPHASASVTTFDALPPLAPVDVRLLQGPYSGTTLTLNWTPAHDPRRPPPVSYEVAVTAQGETLTRATRETSFSIQVSWGEYTFQVRALNDVGPGPWSDPIAGTPEILRGQSTAVFLNGRAYKFGGGPHLHPANDINYETIHEFDPATGVLLNLSTRLPEGEAQWGITSVAIPSSSPACPEGCILLFGGRDGTARNHDEIYRFVPGLNTLTVVARLPAAYHNLAAAWDPRDLPEIGCAGGCVYLFGAGWGGRDVLRFNPHTSEISNVTTLTAGVTGGGAAWTGSDILVAGGSLQESSNSALFRFDPVTLSTTPLAPVLPKTLRPGVFVQGDHAFITAGASVLSTHPSIQSIPRCDIRRLNLQTELLETLPGTLCGDGGVAWTGTEAIALGSCDPETCAVRWTATRYRPGD